MIKLSQQKGIFIMYNFEAIEHINPIFKGSYFDGQIMIPNEQFQFIIQMKKFQEKAIPLIIRQQNKGKVGSIQYQANPEAINVLKSIEGKVAIISVAGIYRTGKSYLLNTIMLKQKGGFGVGPTTNPKTKGIWIWGKPLIYKNEKDEIINVIVMDSEGLGSTEEDINHDLKLFSLTLLLSSMFIYNTIGAIDENAIDSLGLVLKLCDHLKSQNYNDFPDFYWVLRDFSLALVGRDNKPLTPNKYLQNSLSPQPGDSQIRNRIRQSIRSSFVNRSCFTFVRPLTKEEDLQKLDTLDIDQLRPEFTEQVLEFRRMMNSNIKTKKIKGKEMNSSLLIELIKVYLSEINNKKLPQIQTGWKYVCARECQNVLDSVQKAADQAVNRLIDNLPTTQKQLLQKKQALFEQLQKLFQSKTLNNEQASAFKGEISKILERKIQKIQEQMKVKNAHQTKSFIKKQFENIERRLKSGQFKSMGEMVKQFELFYEYYRKKCPYKDEIQTGLEFLMKKFSDCSLLMFKNFKARKDQQILRIREQADKVASQYSARDEKQKHEKTASSDKVAILQSRIQQLNKQNQRLADSLQLIQSEYEKLKIQSEQKANQAEQSSQYQLLSLRKRLMEAQDNIKESQCKQMLELNNLKNQLVLKQNELVHIQEALEADLAKLNVSFKECVTDREEKQKRIDDLISQNQLLKDESERQKKTNDQKQQEKLNRISKLEQLVQAKTSEILQICERKDKEIRLLKQSFQIEKLTIFQNQKQQIKNLNELHKSQLQDRFLKLRKIESDVAQKQLQLKMHRLQLDKQSAILNQKLQFLRQQCSEKQERLNKLQQQNKYYASIFDDKDNQISTLMSELEQSRNIQDNNTHQMNSNIADLTHQLQERNRQISRFQENQEKMKAEIREKEQEIKYLSERMKTITKGYEQKIKDLNERLNYQIQSSQKTKQTLDAEIQLLRFQNSKSTQEQKRNIQLSLVQLKNYYQMERERLEKKILEDRKKHQISETNTIADMEAKHRKVQRGLQEQVQQLKLIKQNLEEQITRIENDYEIKIMAIDQQKDNERRILLNRYELLEKKYADLQQEYENYEKNNQQERITFVKKIQGINFELSRKEKQLLQLSSKRDSLEASLKKKQTQIESVKRMMNQQIEGSLKKVSDIQTKYQKLNEEYMQYKIQSDKQIALCKQRNQFLNAKLQDITRQKESTSSKNIEKLDKQKITDLKEQYDKAKAQLISLESKLQSQRRSTKEQEALAGKKIANLQKEKQFLEQKQAINQSKISDLQSKLHQKIDTYVKDIDATRAKYISEKESIQKQCEDLKDRISVLEDEKSALAWTMQKDIALLNERLNYSQYQKNQIQKQRQQGEKRLQNALQQLKKFNQRLSQENQAKRNQSDKKYYGQIQVMRQSFKTKQIEYQQTIRRQKEDSKSLKQKIQQLQDRLQGYEKQQSSDKNLQGDMQNLKRQKENLMMAYRNERNQQNNEWKRKIGEFDKKYKELQRKYMESMFSQEKQSSKWSMERDSLQEKIKQLEDSLEWERNKSQLNKSKHQLKKSESTNLFSSTSTNQFRSFGTGNNWKS